MFKKLSNSNENLGKWIIKEENLYENVNLLTDPSWHERPSFGEKVDFIALPLTDMDGIKCYCSDSDKQDPILLSPSELISVIGFPYGLRYHSCLATWVTGFVASEPDLNCFLK